MGNVYIFTMINLFLGWPEAVGIPDKKAETVGLTFQSVFSLTFISTRATLRPG